MSGTAYEPEVKAYLGSQNQDPLVSWQGPQGGPAQPVSGPQGYGLSPAAMQSLPQVSPRFQPYTPPPPAPPFDPFATNRNAMMGLLQQMSWRNRN